MRSSLDQVLNAEIELQSVRETDLENLKVTLASDELFRRAQVERADVLLQLRFSVATRKDGTPYLRVTSAQPIREPFLNFLIEAVWSGGRLVRQYTVLVDPPSSVQEAAPAVEAPAAASVAAPVSAPPAAPAPVAAPAAVPAAPPAVEKPQSAVPAVKAARPAPPSASARVAKVENGAYGPTQREDTLWDIASRLRPDNSVTVDQVMLALLRNNPKAFYGNNVNRLKAGYILRVGDSAQIATVSREQARTEIRQQHQDWKSGAASAPVAASGGSDTGAPEGARVKVVSPGAEKAGAAEAEKLQKDLALANETAVVSQKENENLRSRVADLEKQAADMQRLLTLKDNELAAAKQNMGAAPQAGGASSETPLWQNPLVLGLGGVVVLVAGAMAWIMRRRRQGVDYQESILNRSLSESQTSSGATTSAVVAGEGVSEMLPQGESSEIKTPSESSSFLTSFSVGDMEGIQSDIGEVDPVSEADVYLAYGRYKQAEEIIMQAIDNDPGRADLKLKLMEIYYAGKDQARFAERAQEFRPALGGTVWDKIATMGRELCPDHPLFSGESAAYAEEPVGSELAEAAEQTEESDGSLEFDLDKLGPMSFEETAPAEPAGSVENAIDYDVSFIDKEQLRVSKPASPEAAPEEVDQEFSAIEEWQPEQAPLGDDTLFANIDEVGTKLDLAKAYIDMGDADGARSILDEVLQEGNDAQKDEARSLLQQIQ